MFAISAKKRDLGGKLIMPGVVAIQTTAFTTYENAHKELEEINTQLKNFEKELDEFPIIVLCDDANFTAEKLNNFLWVTFTRCNPSHDIYGVNPFTENKHWGCTSVIFDARMKPHNAPMLVLDEKVERKVDEILARAGFGKY